MNNETNLLDVCRAAWHGVVKAWKACVALVVAMLRLSYSHWYIVLPLWIMLTVSLYYRARPTHRHYKVQGIVLLNGPSVEHFKESYRAFATANHMSETANLWTLLQIEPQEASKLSRFESFDVIDMLHDGNPDFVDMKRKAATDDTLVYHMQDRQCIRFRLSHDINLLPKVEEAMLRYFNSDPVMQKEYELYLTTMQRQAKFNHDQIEKLDSLTSAFYFQQNATANQWTIDKKNTLIGDRRIRLFLDQIASHMAATRHLDQRLARATAPVVLEHHLTAVQPICYHPLIMLVGNVLIGWIFGCVIAALVKYWKVIIAFLRG